MSKFALHASGLFAGYGRHVVLRDVDVTVGEGEFVSVIGANGGGKSTLFKCFTGQIRPRSGSITLLGAPAGRHGSHRVVRAGLGAVPEGRQIFPGLTVDDHLRLAATFLPGKRGVDTAATLRRVHEMFPLLASRKAQRAETLSGGQQQMLAIGRALIGDPRVLILDEPSLGLAPQAVTAIFQVLRRLHASGVAILLIEQNAMAALRLADRAYVIESGRVVRTGDARTMADDPDLISHYVGRRPD